MEMIDYLHQARYLEDLIHNKQQEIMELRQFASGISAMDYSKIKVVESSGAAEAKFARVVEKIMELEQVTNEETIKLIDLRVSLNESMAKLPFEEQIILSKKYFRRMTWEGISAEMGMSARTARRIHNKALKKIKIGESCPLLP